jgi:diguanylate cyclase (GGDEF)-like protein
VSASWKVTLAVGSVVMLTPVLVPGPTTSTTIHAVVGLWCVAVTARCAWRQHRGHRAAWALFALAQVAWMTADLTWDLAAALGAGSATEIGDVIYLLAYPLVLTALARLIHQRRDRIDLGALIDSSVITLGVGLLVWVLVAGPVLREAIVLPVTTTMAASYPIADVLVLAVLVHLLAVPGVRSTSLRLVVAASGTLLTADAAFTLVGVAAPAQVALLGPFYSLTHLLIAAAALHPDASRIGLRDDDPHRDTSSDLSRRRLAALTTAALLPPLVLAAELTAGVALDAWPVAVTTVGLLLLLVARMALASHQVVRSTAQRDRLRADLVHQAAHDPLTALVARGHALELVELALARSRRSGSLVGLVHLSLDRFKAVNDAHGHRTGDAVLREVAVRLTAAVRTGDVVGRIGGDEFVVLVEPLESAAALLDLAERLVAVVGDPLQVGARTISPGASAGVVVDLGGGASAVELLHDAEVAAQRAKGAGRGRVEVFDEELRRELLDHHQVEAAVRSGLAAGEFVLHYQAVVDVTTGSVGSYEALIRWERPGHGTVFPDAFIPTVERSDLICDLGRWVLGEATRQLARWEVEAVERGCPERVGVAVNLSGRHLADPRVVADVAAALAAAGAHPEQLELEITETVLVDTRTATAHLMALRELGVRVSIDDFGTGYTSIGQLQHLAADTLKIDRSLVTSSDPGSQELVRLVTHAAHAFGLSVVAEGVESADQFALLRLVGCDRVQGWLFARAQPVERIEAGQLRPTTDAARALDLPTA